MKTYPAYKDSGVAWFGDVPSHWEVLRLGAVLRERGEVNTGNKTENVLSLLKDIGVINYEDKGAIGNKKSEDIERYKIVKIGDIVVNSMNVIIGSVGIAYEDGALSPVYYVLKTTNASISNRYYNYIFQSRSFQRSLTRIGNGILEHRMRIPFIKLKVENVPKPPRQEQDAIVAFLEAKEREIATFIRHKRRTIELLKERLSIKSEGALSQNTDAHQVRIGYYVDLLPGFAFPSDKFTTDENYIRLLRGINVSPNETRWDETVTLSVEDVSDFDEYLLEVGDIVLGMDRPWISSGIRIAEIQSSDVPCLLVQRVARLRAKSGLSQSYLKLLLGSQAFKAYFEPILTGISVPHISPSQILNFRCFIPTLNEQERILKEIEQERLQANKSIELAESEIALIEEYRASLIDAAVTGKIDCRNAKDAAHAVACVNAAD